MSESVIRQGCAAATGCLLKRQSVYCHPSVRSCCALCIERFLADLSAEPETLVQEQSLLTGEKHRLTVARSATK
jgi:hypothetical protein